MSLLKILTQEQTKVNGKSEFDIFAFVDMDIKNKI